MNTYRESICGIRETHSTHTWKKILESDYEFLGSSDDELISPIKYYFNPKGFSAVLSNNTLIISGRTKTRVKNEIMRIKKSINKKIKEKEKSGRQSSPDFHFVKE